MVEIAAFRNPELRASAFAFHEGDSSQLSGEGWVRQRSAGCFRPPQFSSARQRCCVFEGVTNTTFEEVANVAQEC